MTPGKFNLDLYRGDSYSYRFTLWSDEEQTEALDLAGATVAAEIRDKAGGAVIAPLECDIVVPNSIDVSITPAMYASFPKKGVWDLQVTFSSGSVHTVVVGSVTITTDVTDSTVVTP